MEALLNMEPKLFWKHFVEITKIPHRSKHEEKIRNYIKKITEENNLKFQQDETGNVVVQKPASPGLEESRTVILQSHMDMVCEKNKGTTHDFSNDPLELELEGNILRARGTTLGADNGVGVATQLAIMEDKTLKHGPLELLFTVDEESGLTGANGLKPGFITGKILLNLDTEKLGVYDIGCAGGIDTTGTIALNLTAVNMENPVLIKLSIEKLTGGHSGIDIDKYRANAIKLMGRILYNVNNSIPLELTSIHGGSRRNVIPREALAEFIIQEKKLDEFGAIFKELQNTLYFEYKNTDSHMQISYSTSKKVPAEVIEINQKNAIINLLNAFTHGVLAMSYDIKGLVETSTNLAIVKIEDNTLIIETSQRSPVETAKKAAGDSIKALLTLASFEAKCGCGYPGWAPNPDSEIARLCMKLNEKHFKKPAVIEAIHAGLECGIIGEKFPGMEMISMGPTMENVHSPDEYLLTDSVEPFWKLLLDLLITIAKK